MEFGFRLPDIGEGVAEGEVVRWFVREGDSIAEDAPLVSVLTDKANVEIPSPKAGKILRILAKEGERVKVGSVLVTIEAVDEAVGPLATPEAAAPTTAPSPPTESSSAASAPEVLAPLGAAQRVLASPYVRRLAAERGLDLASVTGSGPGGRILETDLPPGPGVPLLASSGATVVAAPTPPAPTPVPPPPSKPVAAPPPTPASTEETRVERIPLRGIRRAIAEHVVEARHRAAHYTYVEEVDATDLVHTRDRMAKHVEKGGLRLSYLPFVIKGVVAGLRAYPNVNARFDDERQELVVHKDYNIGVAAAAPEGLLVPVIRNAERRSLTELAREVQALSEKARAGKLTREEMSGGTFTITSLGALGGVLATPILNYPEVAILGVHKIVRRPIIKPDGSVGAADLMNLSISLDHRVLDGIIAASFLAVVKSYLEEPHQLFAELV